MSARHNSTSTVISYVRTPVVASCVAAYQCEDLRFGAVDEVVLLLTKGLKDLKRRRHGCMRAPQFEPRSQTMILSSI